MPARIESIWRLPSPSLTNAMTAAMSLLRRNAMLLDRETSLASISGPTASSIALAASIVVNWRRSASSPLMLARTFS